MRKVWLLLVAVTGLLVGCSGPMDPNDTMGDDDDMMELRGR